MECPIARAARLHAERLALVATADGGAVRMSWSALDLQVRRVVGALRRQGVGAGACVAWSSPNHPVAFYLAAALPRIGATFVPLNPRLTAAEREPLLKRVKAVRFFQRSAELETAGEPAPQAQFDPQGTHFILFTSGTSGQPKGARLSLGAFIASAEASAERLGAGPTDRWLCTLPLFHVGGLGMLWRAAQSGGAVILQDRFDPEAVCSAMVEEGVSHLSLVDTTLKRLLEWPGPRLFPSSLRAVLVGGGPVSARRLSEGRARGLPLLQTYGLTETASQACTQRPGDLGDDAGPPLSGCAVRIVDEGGSPLQADVPGRIELRAPMQFQDYLDDRVSTEAAFTDDGWLRTGDLGTVDAKGALRVLSRRTDLIIRGGENVYPAEIERVLLAHPGVAEVTVLPEPDETWGQVPVAFVVAEGDHPSPEALFAFCGEHLARFKLPARIRLLKALPRNGLGKVDRGLLRRGFPSDGP